MQPLLLWQLSILENKHTSLVVACVAAFKGEGGSKLNSSAKCEESAKRDRLDLGGNACKETIIIFRFSCPPNERKKS